MFKNLPCKIVKPSLLRRACRESAEFRKYITHHLNKKKAAETTWDRVKSEKSAVDSSGQDMSTIIYFVLTRLWNYRVWPIRLNRSCRLILREKKTIWNFINNFWQYPFHKMHKSVYLSFFLLRKSIICWKYILFYSLFSIRSNKRKLANLDKMFLQSKMIWQLS